MSLDLFFTTINTQNSQLKNVSAEALPGEGTASSAAEFIDLILARLAETVPEPEEEKQEEESTLLDSKNATLDKVPKLNIADLLANNDEIAEQIKQDSEILNLDLSAQIGRTLTLNEIEALASLTPEQLGTLTIDDFNNGLANQPAIKDIFEGFLLQLEDKKGPAFAPIQKILDNIQAGIQGGKASALTANITPAELTDLQNIIETGSPKEIAEALEDSPIGGIFAGLIQIIQPQAQQQASNVAEVAQYVATTPLQPLTQAATRQAANIQVTPEGQADTGSYNPDDFGSKDSFKDLIRQAPAQIQPAANTNANINAPATSETMAHVLSYLQISDTSPTGDFLSPLGWEDPVAEQFGLSNITSAANLTNMVTQTRSAAHSHPATQMIAVTMQQQAAKGENKTLTLQLDPPELGRVEVRMDFSKNKSMQAHMVIEKPETFAMLQRDAHMLERTIQDIGLDADSGVSFELAQDNHDFGHDGGHDGQRNAAGNNGEADGDTEIIETTMTWHVDPNTGHTHYNILA